MPPPAPASAPRRLRRLALAALVSNIAIVFTGGLVRVTGSGLGCPTWPRCDEGSFVPAPGGAHAGWQTAIEFGNRLMTFVVLAAAVAVVWELRRQRSHHPPSLVRLAWMLPIGVLGQALMGGATVLLGLSPWTVAAHFLLSMALIAATVLVHEWTRAADPDPGPPPGASLRRATTALIAVAAVVLVLGTLVTGAGPHAGDPSTPRLGVDIRLLALVHAQAVWLLVGLTVALAAVTWRGPRRVAVALRVLLALQVIQGAIGYVQYAIGIPAGLVAAHILGAALVWTAAVAVWARARPQQQLAPPEPTRPAATSQLQPG